MAVAFISSLATICFLFQLQSSFRCGVTVFDMNSICCYRIGMLINYVITFQSAFQSETHNRNGTSEINPINTPDQIVLVASGWGLDRVG